MDDTGKMWKERRGNKMPPLASDMDKEASPPPCPHISTVNVAHILQQLPTAATIIDLLLRIFDFLTMRHLSKLSRNKTLVILGSVFLVLLGIQTFRDISRRFEELNRTITTLQSDVSSYKRRAYYKEKEAKTTIQHKIAQDILQGLGPAVVKPEVKKGQDVTTNGNEGGQRQPSTPTGSVLDFKNKYINPHDFKYIINNESICAGAEHISYVIYVHTSPDHFDRRKTLRETWAQENLFPGHPSRLIFFLGTTNDETQTLIQEEFAQYGDLIQEDYKDDYHNLTYKGIGALKWISTYCNQTKYVFKSDDDTYLNIFMLMDLLQTQYVNENRFIMCMWWDTMPIMRQNEDKKCAKWCMSSRVFPGRKFFPRYCSGAAYFLSGDVIAEMYSASLRIPFFWVDDVYITGLLTKRVKDLKWLQETDRYRYSVDAFYDEYKNAQTLHWMVTVVSNEAEIRKFWLLTLDRLEKNQIDAIGSDKYAKILKEATEKVPQTP